MSPHGEGLVRPPSAKKNCTVLFAELTFSMSGKYAPGRRQFQDSWSSNFCQITELHLFFITIVQASYTGRLFPHSRILISRVMLHLARSPTQLTSHKAPFRSLLSERAAVQSPTFLSEPSSPSSCSLSFKRLMIRPHNKRFLSMEELHSSRQPDILPPYPTPAPTQASPRAQRGPARGHGRASTNISSPVASLSRSATHPSLFEASTPSLSSSLVPSLPQNWNCKLCFRHLQRTPSASGLSRLRVRQPFIQILTIRTHHISAKQKVWPHRHSQQAQDSPKKLSKRLWKGEHISHSYGLCHGCSGDPEFSD